MVYTTNQGKIVQLYCSKCNSERISKTSDFEARIAKRSMEQEAIVDTEDRPFLNTPKRQTITKTLLCNSCGHKVVYKKQVWM